MTTLISEILDFDLLVEDIKEGFVRAQTHPSFPYLSILNYTDKTAYERRWDGVTQLCRGLIYNTETGTVLARPYHKFHNFDEAEAPKILDWEAPVFSWSNKFDGSLGIAYVRPDDMIGIATRGSFASDQAAIGQELMLSDNELAAEARAYIEAGYTPLYEIIGPTNRIVLMYPEEKLVPLGFIHIETGEYLPHPSFDTTPRSFHSLLQDLSREAAEGWVVWLSPRKSVKVKQADYIELHRIVTGLNRKTVWKSLVAGTFRDYITVLPDELFKWAEDVAAELTIAKNEFQFKVGDYKDELHQQMLPTRKDQALWIKENVPAEFRGPVFTLLDGKSIDSWAWEQVEPWGDSKV